MTTTPKNLKYTREHEWVLLEGKTARIGITDFAQKQLGDIVFVELPEVGRQLDRGKSFGTMESVKAVTEVYAPVSGKVTAVNADIADMPEDINDQPYESWLVKVEVSNAKELNDLMTAEEYDAYCKDE
ncbi:glycine cleavage system protein GcvH [Streptacidiphilus anmyonensis]|uniref:glycine cleavage system protein GcvH n=1 Tax=Streptacidiphilus anmyonensis TaxID=405782 RepID=UPI0005A6D59F|nr:glycine cleavage system protein GcvH [Streptacidiphilus anmyonensis]